MGGTASIFRRAFGVLRAAFESAGSEVGSRGASAERSVPRRERPGAEDSEDSTPGLSLSVLPEKVTRALVYIAVSLALLSFVSGLLWFAGVGPWIRVLNVDNDLSIPSWFSAVLLLFSSLLLAAIAYAKRFEANPRYGRRWTALAIIFLFLSCDEMIRIHERMANVLVWPTLDALGIVPAGMLSNPWVLVYGPLVLIFVLAYLGFWLDLPARVKRLFFAAGALYVGGALGVELATAWYNAADNDFGIFLTTHLEELMEMLGAIVFAYALMTYMVLHRRLASLHIRLGSRE